VTAHSALTVILTCRKERPCSGCDMPIRPGQRYVLTAIPPHDPDYENPRWLRYAHHYPGTECAWDCPVDPAQGMITAAALGRADAAAGQPKASPETLWGRLQRDTDKSGHVLAGEYRDDYELAYNDAYDNHGIPDGNEADDAP
jgi:hypothetical protein